MADINDIKIKDRTPVYKQVVEHIEELVMTGRLKPGEALPSMSVFARHLDISPETVKKAYGILTRRGLLESHKGKGFFVRERSKNANLKILVLTDKLGPFRQAFFNSLSSTVGSKSEFHILLHNQDVELLQYYLDMSLGKYDYYIIMPHFPLDSNTLDKVIRQLSRVPNRQLILADKMVEQLQGNFGAVYQDFSTCVADTLTLVMDELKEYPRLDVFTMENSLYGKIVEHSIAELCDRHGIYVSFHGDVTEESLHKNQVCLLLNSQADDALFTIDKAANKKNLVIGKDMKVISYNDYPLCSIIFGGLTTISADFNQMGKLCAEMILSGEMKKIKCDCLMNRRHTF